MTLLADCVLPSQESHAYGVAFLGSFYIFAGISGRLSIGTYELSGKRFGSVAGHGRLLQDS